MNVRKLLSRISVSAINDTHESDSGAGYHYEIEWGTGMVAIDFQKGSVEENGR